MPACPNPKRPLKVVNSCLPSWHNWTSATKLEQVDLASILCNASMSSQLRSGSSSAPKAHSFIKLYGRN